MNRARAVIFGRSSLSAARLGDLTMLRIRSFSRSTRSMSTSNLPRLPRLPIPPLRKTLDRYLKSIEPFLLEDEAKGGPSFEESYKLRAGWADEFERGIGAKAQEKLIGMQLLLLEIRPQLTSVNPASTRLQPCTLAS